MLIPKTPKVRDKAYRQFVAKLPCVVCQRMGCQAAHLGKRGKGTGVKVSDVYCAPLCADAPDYVGCHTKLDRNQDKWVTEGTLSLCEEAYAVYKTNPTVSAMIFRRLKCIS